MMHTFDIQLTIALPDGMNMMLMKYSNTLIFV